MSAAQFFSVGTVGLSKCGGRKPVTLLQAARHNRRAQQNERGARSHIDPARSHQNETLAGPDTPEQVAALALSLMADAGVAVDKLRKDYTQAIELLFSLPPGTTIDTGDYFRACLAWSRARFGDGNILSADVHRDEAAPHCHVLVLPLVDGRMNAKEAKSRPELARLRASFAAEVAGRFGLKPQPASRSKAWRGDAFAAVLEKLEATRDPVLKSPLWQTIRRDIECDPAPYVEALGVEVAERKRKPRTMSQIFTSKGRETAEDRRGGEATEPAKAIAFDPPKGPKAILCSLCPPSPPSTPTQTAGSLEQAGPSLVAGEVAAADQPAAPADGGKTTEPSDQVDADARGAAGAAGVLSLIPVDAEHAPDAEPEPERGDAGHAPGAEHDGTTRERDEDHAAGQWCAELGEFLPAPEPPSRAARAAADAWVADALAGLAARKAGRPGGPDGARPFPMERGEPHGAAWMRGVRHDPAPAMPN